MNALLITPPHNNVYGIKVPPVYPSLGIMYVASMLRHNGWTVRLVDFDSERISCEDLKKIIQQFNPNIVGLTAVTPAFNTAIKIAEEIKKIRNVPIIVGGIHSTLSPEDFLKHEAFDIIVIGEGEETIKELSTNFDGKNFYNLDKIAGIWFKKDKVWYKNKNRELIQNLDAIAFPAWDLLKNHKSFIPPDAMSLPTYSIIMSRGCNGNCSFCCTSKMFGKNIRYRSIQNIIEEIKYAKFRFKVKEIHIADDSFTADKEKTLEFCEEVKKNQLNLKFVFLNGVRADQIDEEILKGLKSIGLLRLGIGVESINENVLNKVNKGMSIEQCESAFKLCKQLGIETWAFFIIGFLEDTEDTIRKMVRFAIRTNPTFAKFFILKPFPATEIFNELNNKGLIFDFNYSNYGLHTPPVHSLPTLEANKMIILQKYAYRKFYLRPKKILELIIRINSLTQILISIKMAIFIFYQMFEKKHVNSLK